MTRKTNCWWCNALFAPDSTNLCFFCELTSVKNYRWYHWVRE